MKFGCMMTHTQVHYRQLPESHSSGSYPPPKQCICNKLTTIVMTNLEYGQPCMQCELDQSDHAVLRLLPQHHLLCNPPLLPSRTYVHYRSPTAPSMPPMLHTASYCLQLQPYMKCHDIQLMQHCPTSCTTLHNCSWLCIQQAQQRSSGWGVSAQAMKHWILT